MSLRSGLLTLGVVSAATLAFLFIGLCTVVLLVERDSGAALDGLSGATPATASNGADQVALGKRSTAQGEGSKSGDLSVALLVKAPVQLLEDILGH